MNEDLKKMLEKEIKRDEKNVGKKKDVDIFFAKKVLSIGTTVIINYLLCIFFIGNKMAKYMKHDNLYLLALVIGTIINIVFVWKIFKK
ncbi:MAG: hypothetical protein LBT02_01120 [Rickettsiales bacterium]|jgi:hypothetical protein|nr:hypothetical protein [Rickettsiales bacterium]